MFCLGRRRKQQTEGSGGYMNDDDSTDDGSGAQVTPLLIFLVSLYISGLQELYLI